MDNKNRENFEKWLRIQKRGPNQIPYAEKTITNYMAVDTRLQNKKYINVSIFDINDLESFNKLSHQLEHNSEFMQYNNESDHYTSSSFLQLYERYLMEMNNNKNLSNFYDKQKNKIKKIPHNLIYFGAPGTGKSYTLNENIKEIINYENPEKYYERVIFHSDYYYANFVGTYKPTPLEDNTITYKYVPGPFMRVYKKAVQDQEHNYLLIIEEINRAEIASVFGDIFQLLDRKKDNTSQYSIQSSDEIIQYLTTESSISKEQATTLSLPSNMYLWATMNSADQGVFPMDTAFKRRWDFKYMDINQGEALIQNFNFKISTNEKEINWNELRKAINQELINYRVNEDKLMGPFFIPTDKMETNDNYEEFLDTFKNKVLMYLFEDASKHKRNELFNGIQDISNRNQFSKICEEFDKLGVNIFNSNISTKFNNEENSHKEL